MKCVSCGKAELVSDTRDVSYTYKGETTTIRDVSGDYCPVCNESLHNAQESKYLNAAMLAFAKQVNGASIKPEFISGTRKKLQLDQREAAELFGGGPNAFSRYENGKTKPPLALVQLFKILDKHPSLINELKPTQPSQVEPLVTQRIIKRRRQVIA